jgi:CsoR family transcriptional regulator, copper-sensing transcriptional repressor
VKAATAHRAHGYSENREKLLKRLARAEGQVRGIARMVEDDRYCVDILTQLAAVDTALESVALEILDDHVKHCVARALSSGDEADANTKIDELLVAVRRFAKTR